MARVTRAWRGMSRELRMAVVAAFALFVSMFLPWYEKSYFANVKGHLAQASDGLNAFQAFSFVEAAVLLVAIAVIFLCFARGEKKPFHLPGGDGVVVMAAGGWVALLLIYRLFDKPGATVPSGAAVTVGIQWGIFFAIAAAAFLIYTGYRIFHAHRPEPPLPGEVRTQRPDAAPAPPARAETRATEPLVRDQRRRITDRPPSPEARAAADRAAVGRGPAERAEAERRVSSDALPAFEHPAPEAPPEFPHSAGSPPPFPDTSQLGHDEEEPPPRKESLWSDGEGEDKDDPTVAMPGRRRSREDPPDPPDTPDTLF